MEQRCDAHREDPRGRNQIRGHKARWEGSVRSTDTQKHDTKDEARGMGVFLLCTIAVWVCAHETISDAVLELIIEISDYIGFNLLQSNVDKNMLFVLF